MEIVQSSPTTAGDGTKSDWEDKVWGRTRCEISNSLYSRHRLDIKAGGYCSVHYHRKRANQFQVLLGHLRVIELFGWESRTYNLRTPVLGSPIYTFQVPSLVVHQFQAITDCVVLEEYFGDRGGVVQIDDIVRLSEGGLLTPEDLASRSGVIH